MHDCLFVLKGTIKSPGLVDGSDVSVDQRMGRVTVRSLPWSDSVMQTLTRLPFQVAWLVKALFLSLIACCVEYCFRLAVKLYCRSRLFARTAPSGVVPVALVSLIASYLCLFLACVCSLYPSCV